MVDFQKDIHVFSNRVLAGIAAGKEVENCIVELQKVQDEIRIIFAAAPSQNGLLAYLAESTLIQWDKIVALHMDEYIGLPSGAPQFFATYLQDNLFSKVPLKEVHIIKTDGDIQKSVANYAALVDKGGIDIVCLGIGENGHIAFNDPPVADFDDPKTVKVVELDESCRIQQVNDECFSVLEEVPIMAVTLTVPALMKGKRLFCVVLGENKSDAVEKALNGTVSTACPASILTTHPNCKFYFNADAVGKVPELQSRISQD